MNLETLLVWSEPRQVVTKRGDRLLRKAKPTPEFEALYRSRRKEFAALGVTLGEYQGKREVCWWAEVPAAVQAEKAERIAASRATDAEVDLPAPAGLSYRGYQKAGIAFALDCMKRIGGAIIGDQMGLGKSIQGIGIINADPRIQRVLVIVPATLKLNWFREMKKWLTRPLSVGIADGQCFPTTDIVIINYEQCRKYEKSLSFFWDLVICDESHRIKNPKTLAAKAICGYRPTREERDNGMEPTSGIPTRRKLALTGTPIQNKPMEIFTLLNWIDPVRWKSRFEYGRRYCDGRRGYGGSWDFSGASNIPELQKELRSHCFIRRLKADVLADLPPKQRTIILLPADGLEGLIAEERKIEARWQAKLEALRAQKQNPIEFERAKLLLKDTDQDCKSSFRIAHEIALAKVPLVSEHTREALDDGSKIVFFGHHQDALAAYLKEFKDYQPVRVTGEDSLVDRQRAVDRFQTDDRCRIILLSEAGKEGLTLTASAHVIFSEFWWVPGIMAQMEDRTHRIGQRNSVLIEYLLLDGSMDLRKLQSVLAKQEIIDGALDRQPAERPSPPLRAALAPARPVAPVPVRRAEQDGQLLLV